MKKLSQAIALTTAMSAALLPAHSASAEVDVSASAAVANMYLWRGQDLGQGSPAVSGDITASMGGLYGGVWASSGDSELGQEYDLYLGYGGEAGDFSYDISAWTYVYPGADDVNGRGNTFEASDLIVSAGYGPVSASYYYVLAGDENASYATLGGEMGSFSVTLGFQMHSEDDNSEYTHLDLSYAYNDNLAFTLSKVIDQGADLDKGEAGVDEDMKVVVSYSLPIEM
ncbi:hypothetical protein GCM10011297_22230 [Bacterioplanes sanyensis]|uniref:TorF family putative porin n=1 Tax=Bacterioplanes sanyensis TaxID=1249553 RepID=UPI0016731540|nr:TorF family putative porin [Bacterioplanes sanyensis]GGY48970.1 hypothetical protein GCM10011297_22230 [Bacterioplanes sanyensis]